MSYGNHMHCYRVCGIDIRSEIKIPAVAVQPSSESEDVVVRFAEVPDQLPNAVNQGPAFQANSDQLLLRVPNIGRFLVRNGCEILVQREAGASDGEVQVFLTGAAFGALLHQRQILPLHASCIRVGDGAVAFAGRSGAGKSTLAAFLQQRGYKILSDDISAIHQRADGGVAVSRGFGRLKLWSDAIGQLGWNTDSLTRVRTELQKYEKAFDHSSLEEALPLRAVYVLHEANAAQPPGIERLGRGDSFRTIVRQTYRVRFLSGSAGEQPHFRVCAALVSSVPVYCFRRVWDLGQVDDTVARLEDHWSNTLSACQPNDSRAAA